MEGVGLRSGRGGGSLLRLLAKEEPSTPSGTDWSESVLCGLLTRSCPRVANAEGGISHRKHAGVVQWVDRLLCKQMRAGSSPATGSVASAAASPLPGGIAQIAAVPVDKMPF